MSKVTIAVLVTLDSKGREGLLLCEMLGRLGVSTWLVDLSLHPHELQGAAVSGAVVAEAAGTTWDALDKMGRTEAAETLISGGVKILREKFASGALAGAVGVGGANGSTMACAMMRALPPLFPKIMVTPVAATAAVQWYVAESDIAMYPTIGDISLNRITRSVLQNAAAAVSAMAKDYAARARKTGRQTPLIGVSSFGGTQPCVNRVTERLTAHDYEVIHFHSSGPGGRALESLAGLGELAGVVDVTTSELTDLVAGGVYSAGDTRLTAAGAAGLPQVVVPGALDHSNFWVGMAPDRYRHREFIQYNVEILLMRTNAQEYRQLAALMAERLNAACGPFVVLVPLRGFSQHTTRATTDLDGKQLGSWHQPDTDRVFVESLEPQLHPGAVKVLDLHINDPAFADACVDAYLALEKGS